MRKKNKALKNILKLGSFLHTPVHLLGYNVAIISAILIGALLLLILAPFVNSANYGVNSTPSTDSGNPESVVEPSKTERSRIIETGNEVIIDGSLRVLEVNFAKGFDLVETSTPTAPSVNHVRLFAVSIGTATAVKARFDDGTIKVIANN